MIVSKIASKIYQEAKVAAKGVWNWRLEWSRAMKMAWRKVMTKRTIDINRIARCGRIWRKGDNCRVYFNDIEDYLDAEVEYTRSGRLKSVKINGEEIDDPNDINCVGYFDAKDSSFYWEGGAEWVHEAVKKEVLSRATAL